ncbi:MAG: chemotaxis protein CheW [Ruminococcus sp.]|nr:chemotaxis protein CheW [Ruminococcus sp.]
MAAKPGQYLTFELCGHMYAVSIDKIKSILNSWGMIAPVPEFPEYGKGIINFWDTIVPIIDPRMRMNIPGHETAPTTCIIVVGRENESDGMIGLMADTIQTIMVFEEGSICPPPQLAVNSSGYLTGVYKANNSIIMLIEPEYLLTEDMNRAIDNYMESHGEN